MSSNSSGVVESQSNRCCNPPPGHRRPMSRCRLSAGRTAGREAGTAVDIRQYNIVLFYVITTNRCYSVSLCAYRTCNARLFVEARRREVVVEQWRCYSTSSPVKCWLQLRFDFASTPVRRPFDCLSNINKVTVRQAASRSHADLFIYLGSSPHTRDGLKAVLSRQRQGSRQRRGKAEAESSRPRRGRALFVSF